MMRLSRRAALVQLAATSLALAPSARVALALDYPTRPAHIIVGLAAGGPTDLVARVVAQWLSEHLSNQFVVENRTGAGGTLATELLINAPPDGYTLLFAGPTVTISSLLYKKLSNVLDELTPVGVVMRVPNIMIITPSLPVTTVREFIDYAKANPGKLSMASSGVGASPHLSGEYFKSLTKIDMVHVPYRGSGAAYPDLISGKVDVLFDNLGGPALQMVRSGQLRALAVTSARRWPLLPDLPAIAETVPGYDVDVWYGMFAPKSTPPEIVARLNTALASVVADPQIAARFAQDGGLPSPMPLESLGKFLHDDQARWRKMVEAAGLTAE
ncbi:MAG TPA: tripartite tricarboxylate transporter substrate binding protein [Xanthobacteraceae bacterium]|nr:tripartite tricarboxylate transporter substrate binding protein [Xanthobacteraceae bacterium]